MKRMKVMLMVLLFSGFFNGAYAQRYSSLTGGHILEARPLLVTFYKTTSLIFPFEVKDYDYGSNGIIVEQTKRAKNILHVKAARKGFEQTNLTVILSDGSFHAFVVDYAENVNEFTFLFKSEATNDVAFVDHDRALLDDFAGRVREAKPFLYRRSLKDHVALALQGVYASDQSLWLKMRIVNRSAVDFRVGYVKFFLKDKRRLKRRAIQETEIVPIYTVISAACEESNTEMILGFDRFDLSKSKQLVVQVGEMNDVRLLKLKIKGNKIAKARKI